MHTRTVSYIEDDLAVCDCADGNPGRPTRPIAWIDETGPARELLNKAYDADVDRDASAWAAQRNKLRTEFGMATIPVSAEVEKLYSAALRKAFRDWSEAYPHRAEIEAEVLQIIREEKRDPHWLPRGLLNGALWFGHLVRKRLHRIWLQEMQNFDERHT